MMNNILVVVLILSFHTIDDDEGDDDDCKYSPMFVKQDGNNKKVAFNCHQRQFEHLFQCKNTKNKYKTRKKTNKTSKIAKEEKTQYEQWKLLMLLHSSNKIINTDMQQFSVSLMQTIPLHISVHTSVRPSICLSVVPSVSPSQFYHMQVHIKTIHAVSFDSI